MKLIKRTAILAKDESQYGVWAQPTAADGLMVSDMRINPIGADGIARNLVTGKLGAQPQLRARERVEIGFRLELTGTADAGTAPHWGKLLCGAGWAESITTGNRVEYTPSDNNFSSLSISYVVDGTVHRVSGCRGSASVDLRVAAVPTIELNFTGLLVAIVEEAQTPTTQAVYPLPILPSTQATPRVEFAGQGVKLSSLQLALGAQIELVEYIGHREVQIVDRQMTGEMVVQAPSLAEQDFFTLARSNALSRLVLEHGTQDGQRMRFDAPKVQLSDVRYADLQGIVVLEADLRFTPALGQDELKITVY